MEAKRLTCIPLSLILSACNLIFPYATVMQPSDGKTDSLFSSAEKNGDASLSDVSLDFSKFDLATDALMPSGTIKRMSSDPFGDSTSFAYVFVYHQRLYLGPRSSGAGAVRINPDGTEPTPISFSFPADTNDIGSLSTNKMPPPFPSIGFSGCTANTYECGPDNENGRGVFAAGLMSGKEWLILAGGRTQGNLTHIYMSDDVDSPIHFRYVDLEAQMGPQTKGSSAIYVFKDIVYLGFPDTGGKRPYLVALKKSPGAPGLDIKDKDLQTAENLAAHKMPGFQSTNPAMIDTLIGFNERLYLFNHAGCIRSTKATPSNYENAPGDWTNCTPNSAPYTSAISITLPANKVVDIEPSDKAFPQVAEFKGRLYVGRNTTSGPQLWSCVPETSGDAQHCDPGDWQLVAANAVGQQMLTQFNNVNNVHVSLIVSTANHLYIGFDNLTDGVALFRSNTSFPQTRSDFEGQAGCSAAQYPTSCTGIGGSGLSDKKNFRIFSGVAANIAGRDYVYLISGREGEPDALYRIFD